MPFNASVWANPNQFSDISTYSGLDEKSGINSLKNAFIEANTGIKPPETGASGQSFGQQIMGSVAPNLQKYGSAMEQVGQGNISGAANTMGFKAPSSIALKLPSLGQPVNTGMNSQFED
jgi:hypothetical protein